ncbi:UvrD-helicase domain-containing protein [Piscinibacter gummiphilus]|uniref:DNA 3'-5' helicase n=1 Tax=Piscinibacter gummiphilus TaxID=946333 RepID=A0ABZ0D3G2_9BURK|nr:UvrD-helicase domain-containing protein [Piscinibacter gummiphilus]WOB11331.1 UvrD-helicase domain-containing protein [Piscinibacter gummiphilus]
MADAINQRQMRQELVESRAFFDSVEKSPLTQEQAEAVICFDSRVLLVASAGSGKTSTMVAKAGYALKRNYFSPDEMLLLAFNNDAAVEMRERIKARLKPLGLPAERVAAKTFHAFGLEVIGNSTGRRPSVATWVQTGQEQEALLEMVDELKSVDPVFRTQWDLFRLIFGQDLPRFGSEASNPDAWDKQASRDGFRTLNNEVVRSRGELVIANWLFYNGVRYLYEAPYRVDTADASHRQYQPDFYLPDADAYLEHWALDANGEPPSEFVGYKEGMTWKKQLHALHGTRLLETTMADLWSGRAFIYLEHELRRLGVTLDANPDRPIPGRQPVESPRLVGTIRSFLTHAKSNRLSIRELHQRLNAGTAGHFKYRHALFLSIFEKLWARWEERLRAHKAIDFEDMLNLASEFIEQGRWDSPYKLVMVDEFQDVSHARARILSALTSKPYTHLFAVGDDWQSINRFAGADLSVMTGFESMFGKAVTMTLATTFRCPQALCDISSHFVQKNPRQLRKNVKSPKPNVVDPVRIVRARDESEMRSAIEAVVDKIACEQSDGTKASVLVLGRYGRDAANLPSRFDADRVEVKFHTVHSSKGLERDHVIVPRMSSETLGFPSQVVDDPVLQLAMPGGDSYVFAEERRLFYVALTRARQTVTLVTIARKESAFITELIRDHRIRVQDVDGMESDSDLCPTCGIGFVIPKTGRYGRFFGCSNHPRCKYSRNAETNSGRLPDGAERTTRFSGR